MLNESKGNMYPFVSHTWNPIKGKCPHDCKYCYMKRFPQKELRLIEKELQTDLGKNNFIFVGSSTDIFAEAISSTWIEKVLAYCSKSPENTYLFQSKNPERFREFDFPKNVIFGTTIETNKSYLVSLAPSVTQRYNEIYILSVTRHPKIMISIEPILDFDLDILVGWIKKINPVFVSIGADSKGHDLPEPSPEKVSALIKELKKFTEVKEKNNLKRLKELK